MSTTPFTSSPLVSVVVLTGEPHAQLGRALASVADQTYDNLQVLVARWDGPDPTAAVTRLEDERFQTVAVPEGAGKARALNAALARCQGAYIAHLDDDGAVYPHHVERLLAELHTAGPDVAGVYADFYRTLTQRKGRFHHVLGKSLAISRDFERDFLLHFNHVLRSTLMHRADLLGRIGPLNPTVRHLVDWDLTRRLSFFGDLVHVCEVTGEYDRPADTLTDDQADDTGDIDAADAMADLLTIRTVRPPKPWPASDDLAIIIAPVQADAALRKTLWDLWIWTFAPFQVRLAVPTEEFAELDTDMANLVHVPVDPAAPLEARIDAALAGCDSEWSAVVSPGLTVQRGWVEGPLKWIRCANGPTACLLGEPGQPWSVLLATETLRDIRDRFAGLSLRGGLSSAGMQLQRVDGADLFAFDQALAQADAFQQQGQYARAAAEFESVAAGHPNRLWALQRAAAAHWLNGQADAHAARLLDEVNRQRPTVESLLLASRLYRRQNDNHRAKELLEHAEQLLTFPA